MFHVKSLTEPLLCSNMKLSLGQMAEWSETTEVVTFLAYILEVLG
jgi:hypothetical protein